MRRYARTLLNHMRDRRAFSRIAPIPCDTSALARIDDVDLANVFKSDNAAWLTVERDIASLQISTTAGGVNVGDRRAVYELVKYLRPQSVLEAGTHVGASTVHISCALRELRAEHGGESYSFDTVDLVDVNDNNSKPWIRLNSTYSPAEMVRELGCGDIVKFYARDALEYLANCTRKYDFIFLDDNHDASHVYQEIPLALNCLNRYGYILLHDYFPDGRPLWSNRKVIHGPYWAAERLRREGADIRVLPLGELPWPTKLDSNVTSLALLGRA